MIKVKVVDRPEPTASTEIYLKEVIRGMGVSARHFFQGVFTQKSIVTVQYPEVKRPYPKRFRGHHRLMKREDNSARCVACFMCATACPSNCITIDAGEREEPYIQKFPIKFEIDYLKCVFCGLCVDACPQDALRMDSDKHRIPAYTRRDEMSGNIDLLALGGLSQAKQGGKWS